MIKKKKKEWQPLKRSQNKEVGIERRKQYFNNEFITWIC